MTSHMLCSTLQSQDTPENPHTIMYEGMNIHDVLSHTITNLKLLQKLLDQGERPCSSGQCFILAARTCSLAVVKKLHQLEPSGINTQDECGNSLLSYFARQPKDLLQLLKMGANPAVGDIQIVLERVILYSDNKASEVIKILNIVTSAGVQIDNLNDVHIFKDLVRKPCILKHMLNLGVSINPNMPGIHGIMKTITKEYTDSCLPILTQILTYLSNSGVSLVDNEGVTLLKYCSDKFRLIKTLITLGTPLQEPYVQYALETLVSWSYSQADISDGYNLLNSIVNRGHQLVDRKGNSLIKYCRNKDILLYLLRSGADPDVPQIHILLEDFVCSCSDHGELKEILSTVAEAGVKLVDKEGCSLIKISKSTDMVCHLLQLGASPFYNGENLIKETLRNCHSEDYVRDLKLLIESGFSILDKDKHGCTFLCSVIEICFENANQNNIDASYDLVRFILNHPGILYKNFKLNCKLDHHPQDILARCHRLHDRLADLILTSKFKDTCRVRRAELIHDYCNPADMTLMTLYLKNNKYSSVEDIDYLYEHGFSVYDPGVSPLTASMLLYEDKPTIVKTLLQRGVNVEQRLLVFKINETLQDFKDSLKIPDALILAAFEGALMEVIKLLAPHSAFPPLVLLLFNYKRYKNENQLLRDLLTLGRVPHGTQAYRAIRKKVREMAARHYIPDLLLPVELDIPDQVGGIESQELTMFDVAHRSPLSLLELSRYAVKMCLADTAAASNTQSLPQLFKSLLPPGLTDQHIAHKIAQVRNCEVKWLSNEEELLNNPPSLMFVKSVLNIPDVEYDIFTDLDDPFRCKRHVMI